MCKQQSAAHREQREHSERLLHCDLETELYSLWCTQSSTDSCLWGWTTSASRFSLVPLWSKQPASERLSEREREREKRAPKHRVEQQTGRQMYGQTDRWRLQRTPFTQSILLFTLIHHCTMHSPSPQLHRIFSWLYNHVFLFHFHLLI